MDKFEIFKEINVGGSTKERLVTRLSESGIQFNNYAHLLFEHSNFLPPTTVEKVQLVKVSLADLKLDKAW